MLHDTARRDAVVLRRGSTSLQAAAIIDA